MHCRRFQCYGQGTLLGRTSQYLDSGFRRNDGLKAGASPGYFADEICSLRFDRLSANGKTGSARMARQAQGERQDRLSANGKTGSARMARQAQRERQDRLSANGKTGTGRMARQAECERQDRHRANGETGSARMVQGARLGRYVWFCKGALRDTAKTVR